MLVQPEDGGSTGGASAANGQLYPVANGDVLGLAQAPDVALTDEVLRQHCAFRADDTHSARISDFEGLVVRPVLFRCLRHEADVAHVAHGGNVVRSIRLAVVDDHLVNAGVATVRDERDHVVQFAVRAPHASRGADSGGHRGVDDHIARHMQVGDALVGIDHGQRRTRGEGDHDVRFHRRTPVCW